MLEILVTCLSLFTPDKWALTNERPGWGPGQPITGRETQWLQLPGAERVETVRQGLHRDPHWRYISDMTVKVHVTVCENDNLWCTQKKGMCYRVSWFSLHYFRFCLRCEGGSKVWPGRPGSLLHIRRERVENSERRFLDSQWNSAGRDTAAIYSSFAGPSSCSWGLQHWLLSDDTAVEQKQTGNVVWIHVQVSPWQGKCS